MMAGMRVAIVFVAIVGASAVTPMTKVVTLLKNLQTKVEEQGQKEALQYEKYSCFCKNQASSKQADIAASVKEIGRLDAIISNHDAIIGELGGDVGALNSGTLEVTGDITTETGTRATNHETNIAESKEYQDAIDLVDEAIDRMRVSKGNVVNSDLYLTQLKSVALNAKLGVQPKKDWLKTALALVKTAGKGAQATAGVKKHIQAPHASKYASNVIISTLQTVLKTLKEEKFAVDTREGTDSSDSESDVQAMNNQVKFKNMDLKQTQTALDAENGKRAQVDQKRTLETNAKNADQNFLNTLVTACEEKASDWDQRSEARADEMSALAEAIAFLQNGAVAKYKVNKKLVGLQYKTKLLGLMKVSAVPKSHHHHHKKRAFLQIGKGALTHAEAGKRVLALLDSAASGLKSQSLSALAFKVQLKIDHFENVRALIKDLVTKLEGDASSEADTKSMCDTQMKLAVDDRDLAQSAIEEQNGIAAVNNAIIAEKKAEIVQHEKDIAERNKEKMELNKFRATEKADNAAAVIEAQAGHDAVESAIQTLNTFYGNLLQVKTQRKYTPPNSDRNGKTVADAAPKAFSGDYGGAQAESKGVIGILEVISADFLRTVEAIGGTDEHDQGTEDEAAENHKTAVENNDDEVGDLIEYRNTAVEEMEDAEGEVVGAKSEANDRKGLKASSKAQLEKLSSMCVEGEETYEERVAKREKEMAALRDAMKLLDQLMA